MEVRTIDYVVPMVFHDDPLWQQDYKKVRIYDEKNLFDFVRFRSWGTEHLLVRCVKRFMPFVRNIYVILARESQRKAWMDDDGVRIVYHRDFIPERFLPTFNSATIEMFLHRIPGISDRFIYGNDDMFPVSELNETDFFDGDVPCLHHEEKAFPENPNIFHNACRNSANFAAREFGKRYDRTFLKGGHSMTPMLRKTWEYLWWTGGDDIMRSISAFRESRNFYQWIAPFWHHHAGNYVDRVPERVYVSTRDSVEKVGKGILGCSGIVCVNDNECEGDYTKYGVAVRAALEERLSR